MGSEWPHVYTFDPAFLMNKKDCCNMMNWTIYWIRDNISGINAKFGFYRVSKNDFIA